MYYKVGLPGYFRKPPPERVICCPLSVILIRDYGCGVPKTAKGRSFFQMSPGYRMRKQPIIMLCKGSSATNR